MSFLGDFPLCENLSEVLVVHAAAPLVPLEVLHDLVVALSGRPLGGRRSATLLPVLEQPLYYLAVAIICVPKNNQQLNKTQDSISFVVYCTVLAVL